MHLKRSNLIKSFLVLCLISFISICVFSQNNNYQAVGMELDNAGNIFVVGKCFQSSDNADIILVKYNASGIQLWAKTYNGVGNKNDEPFDIDIDNSGNVYICGKTLNTSSNYDYLTLKYTNDGQLLWAKMYNGPAGYIDEAKAIVVNKYGSVYVTGTCTNLGPGNDDEDIMTVKYDTNGNVLWSKSYSGSPNDDKDIGIDIGIDSNGDVYVGGYTKNASTYEDYVLIKYTASGTQSWAKIYNGAGGDYDIPTKVFVDSGDNIYITGYSYGGASGEDWATLKYDTSGNLKWEKRYNGSGDGNDRPSAIAVDSSGSVYVSGYSDNFPYFNDITTVKYNSAGTQIWINKFDGPSSYNDEAVDVAVYNNNVFVFGKSYGSTAQLYDYVLIKYNLDGTKEWLARYNKGNEFPSALSIDDIGNIYVTGSTQSGAGVYDLLTIRYNQSGQEVWVKGFVTQVTNVELTVGNGSGLPGDQVIIPVTVSNLVEAVEWGFDLKFESGKLDFVKVQEGAATNNWVITGNEISAGVLRITGTIGGTGTAVTGQSQEIVLVTFQIQSGVIGVVPLVAEKGTSALANAKMNSGQITIGITGVPTLNIGEGSGEKGAEVTIPVTLDNVSDCKEWGFDLTFDISRLAYIKVENGSSIEDWNPVTATLSGNTLTVEGNAGTYGTTLAGSGFEIAKITFKIGQNASGIIFLIPSNGTGVLAGNNELNTGQITVEQTMGYEEAIRVALDQAGNVYATGVIFNEQNLSGILTVKYDNNGNEIWSEIFDVNTTNPPTYEQFRPVALAVHTDGSVYIAAKAWVGEPGHDYVSDYFTLKYDTDGNILWYEVFNGFDFYYDDPVDMDLDDDGNVYITGKSWDPGGYDDIVTIKYNADGGIPDPNGDPYNNPVWCARYHGESVGIAIPIDEPSDLVVKFDGVYIVGKTFYKNQDETPPANDFDALILKYDKETGEQKLADRIPMFWKDEDGNPKRADDIAKKVDVCENHTDSDVDYDIYVSVHSLNAVIGDWEIVTVKYPDYSNQLPPSPAPKISYDNQGIIISEQEPTLIIGTNSGVEGETKSIDVTVKNVSNFDDFEFDLSFNSTLLEYVSVDTTGLFTDDWDTMSVSTGVDKITIKGLAGAGTVITDSGAGTKIVKINFMLKSVDTTTDALLVVTALFGDLGGVTPIDGRITIYANLTVSVSSEIGPPGGEVEIPIVVYNAINDKIIDAPWGFDLVYDITKLEYIPPVENGADASDWSINANEGVPGTITITGSPGSPINGSDLEIVVVKFKINDSASGATVLNIENLTGDLSGADVNPGIVTVSSNALYIGSGFGSPGDQITISVNADISSLCDGFGFGLEYDANKLSLVKITRGKATDGWVVTDPNTNKKKDIITGQVIYTSPDNKNELYIYGNRGSEGDRIAGAGIQIVKITFQILPRAFGKTYLIPFFPDVTDTIKYSSDVIDLITYNPFGGLEGSALYSGSIIIFWKAIYDGPALSNDEPFDLELVPPGNPPTAFAPGTVYITGRRTGTNTGYDYVTLKYNLWDERIPGAVLDLSYKGWVAGYNAPKNDTAIAVEYADLANVKVIVTGYSYLTANDTEFMTIGYDYDAAYNANREEWRANYPYQTPGKNLNQPNDLVLDDDGNAYIAGKKYTAGSSGYDFVVLKYKNNGDLLWERIYGLTAIENWAFRSVMGNSTPNNVNDRLTITYNNTTVFSYWQRPYLTNVVRLEPDTIYKATATVFSNVTGSTTGSYPDFRLYSGTYSGTGNLYFVSSFLSNGGSNYISPSLAGRDYIYYFEPTGLTPNPPSPSYTNPGANLVFQFEGLNFPFGGRPNLIGTSVGLSKFVLEKYSNFDVNAAGTPIHSITSSTGFALGSGTANGWTFSSPTFTGNARATGSKAADNQGLVIKANPLGANPIAYGVFDANPFIATNTPSFNGGNLYRATFNITTNVVAGGGNNIPIPQARLQTGDSHIVLAANLNSLSPLNKIIGPSENSSNYIDLWFYYPNTRTAGVNKENKLFPSFEILVLSGLGIPDGASITLRDFWLTKHPLPTP